MLLVAAVVGALALLLRQPLVVSFIAVGILVGPAALGIVDEDAAIDALAEIGIAALLFVVGLRLDLRLIRSVGPVAVATGLGQVAFTSAVGFLICIGLGLGTVTSAYVAVALTFSSTIIIVKLLSDKREIDELHGRIAVGFLIVQDIVVVLAMILITAFAGGGGGVAEQVAGVIAKGLLLLAGMAVLMRWVLTPVVHRLARSPELLVLAALAWALGVAVLTDLLGFSIEVGAFLAGVALASTPFRDALGSRLTPLRDFLLLFFFVDLGVDMELGLVGDQIVPAVVLSLFVLIGNPLIVLAIMGAMGYRRRVAFLAGLTVAQISEFSLVLAALGLSLGQIDRDAVGLITLVGLITISLSTYMILHSQRILAILSPYLAVFERRAARDPELPADMEPPDVVVFGLGRYGLDLARGLEARGMRVLGVDFDPSALEAAEREGIRTLYGDAEDPHLPESLPLPQVRAVVSTLRRREAEAALAHSLRHHGYRGRVALTAQSDDEVAELRGAGADLVLRPFRDAAERAVEALLDDGRAAAGR